MKAGRFRGVPAVVGLILLGGSSTGPLPAPPPAADPAGPPATVMVHGRAGTFGTLTTAAPSGQSLGRRVVPGWGLPAGLQASGTVLAADGTVLIAGLGHNLTLTELARPTSAEMVVAAYDPRTNTYANVRVQTSTGRERIRDRQRRPAAPSVADLEPVADGAAVAFVAAPTHPEQGTADGQWPAFGILSKVDGRWQVARGAGWANQWTGAELRAASPGAGARFCPPVAAGEHECGGPVELAALPRSRDLIVAQYAVGGERRNGALAALRVTGPDAAGRFAVKVMGHYPYPEVKDPSTADPDDLLDVAPRWSLHADPTSPLGDERFAVTFQLRNRSGPDPPGVLQEFTYDADSGAIRPASAPIIPGDQAPDKRTFYSYGAVRYDSRGNLWAGRSAGFNAGSLAVYARTGSGRRPGTAPCPYDPRRRMDSYVTTAAGRTVWGQTCRPDYDIVQARAHLGGQGIVEDPVTHDIVSLSFGGVVLPIRVAGSGNRMTFRVGNQVDLGRKLLPTADGTWRDHRLGMIDTNHRLWIAAAHARPGEVDVRLDQWLYSVALGDLFTPLPVALPDTPGHSAVVEAEHTQTTTTSQRPGRWATVEVDSDAYVAGCADWPANVGCGYDGTPGNGFVLADDSGYGHLGGAVEYRVQVHREGEFRLAYRVAAFPILKNARIELQAGGRRYVTAIIPGEGWRTIWSPESVALPAGTHTIRLSAPPGGGGWALNSLTLQRA